MEVVELKGELLDTKGLKAELVRRLTEAKRERGGGGGRTGRGSAV